MDGDPSTAWSTDRRPSPYPDEDIGLVVTLPVLAEVGDVWIDSLSPGATVEIRTVPDRSGRLDSTRILGTGTIEAGVTRIAVATPDPTDRLLVRLTGLAPVDGGYQTSLSEIGFTGKR
ncbi:hypothetical protein [Rhodococcus triatomae]|uniref:hypothetical protein n=1 Tax=Rhodococcus triatomae TaxID=300028 RepID=UPI0016231ED5|nr:hypothetical protein [Rhodococcus triatomae]QNG20553.1 hypothetical protein G4H72_19150 [Rhodococcus triatomae]